MQKIQLSRTQKQQISHNCSGMKLTVLYSQWSRRKDFRKLSSFFKYFTIHSTSLYCFCGLIASLFNLHFLLFILFGLFNVSDNVSVSSLVRFIYTFSVYHPFCNFSSIAATVAGSCRKYSCWCGCFAFPCRGNENCLFSSCGMTLYTAK